MRPAAHSARQSLWMVGAGLSFALMAVCIKEATVTLSILELGLWRSVGGAALVLALIRLRRQPLAVRHPATHLYRAVWGMAAVLMFYYAIDALEPSVAYALNYTAPILFILLSAVHLRERLDGRVALAALGCFSGVLLLLRPDLGGAEGIAGIVGVASGACAAMAFLMVRKLGRLGEGGLRTVFFLNLHGCWMCAAGLALFGGLGGLGAGSLLPLAGVIAFATTGQLALTRALSRGASAVSAALSYSGVFFAVVIDALLRGVDFSARDLAGFALIVGFGSLSLWLARTRSRIEAPL